MASSKRGKKAAAGKTKLRPTATQRRARRDKSQSLQDAITKVNDRLLTSAKKIAKDHSKSLCYVTSRLLMGGKLLRNRRAVNAWTVFLTDSLAEINAKRKPGDKIKMSSIPADLMQGIKDKYATLEEVDMEKLREDGAAARKKKATSARTSEVGRQKDFDATFSNLLQDVVAVQERTRCEVLVLAVRGDTMHTASPILYASPRARAWISWKFKLSLPDMGLHLEAFVVGNLGEGEFTIVGNKINDHVAWVRERIGASLLSFLQEARLIKPGEKVKMAYKNYEDTVVKRYSVELRGWPLDGDVQDPAKLTRPSLNKVIDSIKEGSCRWERLTAEELRARLALRASRPAPAAGSSAITTTDVASFPSTSAHPSTSTALLSTSLLPPTPLEAAALDALAYMSNVPNDFDLGLNGAPSFILDGAGSGGAFTPGTSYSPLATVTPYGQTPFLLDDETPPLLTEGGLQWVPESTFNATSSAPNVDLPPLTWPDST
ncbi:hypothetical protein FA95DRAFT_1613536 [Auriscalpium vulgare]|uniref:Uncharacterized protein n=1 Tax=Auriscalpium vulgare TaxID=40419 RepID=A0ACB8R2K6_9AGAM|nr:hypothetical protein FA95DRAFT_1613536 [Auriscalpium vulgare]